MRDVVALELPRSGRRELEPRDTWVRMSTRLVFRLDLELVCGGTRSSGYRRWPSSPP
jgi:hypothetical protein